MASKNHWINNNKHKIKTGKLITPRSLDNLTHFLWKPFSTNSWQSPAKSTTIFTPKYSDLLLLWLADCLKIYLTSVIRDSAKTHHFKVQHTILSFLFKAFHANTMGCDRAHHQTSGTARIAEPHSRVWQTPGQGGKSLLKCSKEKLGVLHPGQDKYRLAK